MPAFKRDSASRLRDAERCMKGGEPLTMREASFISSLIWDTPSTSTRPPSDSPCTGGGLYCYAYVIAQNAQIGHVM